MLRNIQQISALADSEIVSFSYGLGYLFSKDWKKRRVTKQFIECKKLNKKQRNVCEWLPIIPEKAGVPLLTFQERIQSQQIIQVYSWHCSSEKNKS